MIRMKENALNIDSSKCCGCFACKDVCPRDAVTIVRDKVGFLYPEIDKEKCISCGLCSRVCAYRNGNDGIKPQKVFAAASANIQSHHGNFPGLIVFTDQRLIAVSALPGIRRLISLPLKDLLSCKSKKSPLAYNVTVKAQTDGFSAMLSPKAGDNFAPYILALERAVEKRYS